VGVSEAITDDLYVAAGTVTVTGPVDGDVVATGGTVELDGRVTNNVLAAGGTVRIGGQVGRTLRAAAGTLDILGTVGGDAVLAGGNVMVGGDAKVGRDLVVGGGNVIVAGNVQRNLLVDAGEVTVGSTVRGAAEIHARRLVLMPAARIAGHLGYSADEPLVVQPGAQVAGGIERLPNPPQENPGRLASPAFWLGTHLLELLALIVLGLAAFGLTSRGAGAVAREVADRFGRSLLAGFILLVVVPAAAFVLLFTIVAIPLSFVVMLLYFATLYPSQVFVAAWMGDRLVHAASRGRPAHPSVFLALAVGSVLLVLLFAIPYIGWLFRLVAVLAGFGALWMTVWSAVAGRPATASPPVAPT
jgi:cytoskeletal protein CcmA (bactofilin family)